MVGIALPIFVVWYFVPDFETLVSHSGFTIVLCMALLSYLIGGLLAIKKFIKSIHTVAVAVHDLKARKIGSNGNIENAADLRSIITTLREVQQDTEYQINFAEQLKSGNLDAGYTPRHEKDDLGKALLNIKESLISIHQEDRQRNWTAESHAKFVQLLQSAKNLKELSNNVIINLVQIINANQGAIFTVQHEEGQEILEMQACYAYNRSKHFEKKVFPGQGLVGQVYLEKETVVLKNIPDKFLKITSGLGEANPKYVLIVPLKISDNVVGIVELASFKEFNSYIISFVEKIGESIAHAFSSYHTAENTRRLLEESKAQTEALRAQEEELRQNQEELEATQEAISRKYDMLFRQLGELNYQSKFDQLKSITSTKKRNIEFYFDNIRNQITTFAENTMVVDAIKAFHTGFYAVASEISPEKITELRERVSTYYSAEFVPRLRENTDGVVDPQKYIPQDVRALIFQDIYIASNPNPTGQKLLLHDAADGSAYGKAHAFYHPIFRSYLEKFGYYDIFLIDAASGDMLYSVFKEIDFATNLKDGIYSTTNFGKVVNAALESNDRNFVRLIDFESYDPSYHAPASFIASVIYDGSEKIGILVFQMPINKINQILTGDNKWREDGLGETGETFIVGGDFKLRSMSRQLIENPQRHLQSLKNLNYDRSIIQQIKKMQTSILMEEIKTTGIGNALKGQEGTSLEDNSHDQKILSAYAPLNIPDVEWAIVSTMDENEASQRIRNLRNDTV